MWFSALFDFILRLSLQDTEKAISRKAPKYNSFDLLSQYIYMTKIVS